ncbi:MAG: T9SS type A sorting domain-containing protein, partial [Bacteroidetes bacterium]|nr:T9SS type A sorting domain-containing protein [Bacteroidota bacterium]
AGPGIHEIIYGYDEGNGCNSADTQSIYVIAEPAKPVVTEVGNKLISTATIGNQWLLDGSILSGATAQELEPAQSGNYSVISTVDGCVSDTSNEISYKLISGNGEIINGLGIEIIPNPNSGQFRIQIGNVVTGPFNLEIVNSLGQIIFQKRIERDIDQIEVHLTQVLPGMYLIKLSGALTPQSCRMVIH